VNTDDVNTRVHIERIVLDGITLSRRDRDALGPAIARELRRLAGLAENLPPHPRAEQRRPQESAADGIARQVAAAVHQATAAATPATARPRRPGASGGRR
jgi:hypothetical protein